MVWSETAASPRLPFSFNDQARRPQCKQSLGGISSAPRRSPASACSPQTGHGRSTSWSRSTDTLDQEYPYRAWEDLYRDEFTWDHVGYAAHCINCVGNCAFRIYVKDGIVLREEQLAEYPQINPDTP